MRAFICLAVCLLFSGCGVVVQRPSSLQQLDAQRTELATVSAESSGVARQSAAVASAVAGGNERWARRQSGRWKASAGRLMASSGASAARLRAISLRRSSTVSRMYIRALLRALADEWWEGATVRHEANLVWEDPLMSVPGDASRLARLDVNARWYAWQGVQNARQAQAMRRRYPREFRYVPLNRRV